jgi:hypothetical protein
VSNSVLATEAKAFQGALLHIQNTQASGGNGGGYTTGSFNTCPLNTVQTNDLGGSPLSSNQITLAAGTYWIDAIIPMHLVGYAQARLRNITDSTTIASSIKQDDLDTQDQILNIRRRFTLASSKVLELQVRAQFNQTTNGFGAGASFGETEVFADVCIWKIA